MRWHAPRLARWWAGYGHAWPAATSMATRIPTSSPVRTRLMELPWCGGSGLRQRGLDRTVHEPGSRCRGGARRRGLGRAFSTIPVVGNFDDDAFDDLALGFPGAPSRSRRRQAPSWCFGSAAGLSTADRRVWRQSSPASPAHRRSSTSSARARCRRSQRRRVGRPRCRRAARADGTDTLACHGDPRSPTGLPRRIQELDARDRRRPWCVVDERHLRVTAVRRRCRTFPADDLVLALPYTMSARSARPSTSSTQRDRHHHRPNDAPDAAGSRHAESHDYFAGLR